ncbi:urea ABC transporter substrate-binding protein [Aeribacillus pallidus]|jgi:urea transport system substrate-binding protein|uniref:Urea ABC transporter substrate-binding protein n=1 Tax=Aeribacillus pallidus TaxID=33936 RepID=A0A165YTK2_9BACI|nr:MULTISPECIES: urea ABC transporter substrate-binding protein [Aeribacillus]ASS90857.1 urea ABC transporter substrate-binding protein [Aeribacillus pallidus]KZN97431.1 urea ABC transporter substrate-binding protein [Aeribacillus pallidus]MDR9796106.1 urea ABC transporter substrate-binding protein [Aeribacillus pallidus]MED0716797.1 urea ABC transporter substrate-binding protein [Aeribacillus composti]MED0746358.1 urea ABC transporter substrate-binding protein [Aeribacillus composti]
MKKIFLFLTIFSVIFASGCAMSSALEEKESSDGQNSEQNETDVVKVGILHSLSGTMAISEVSLKDAELMAIEEINNSGGLLGKKIEPVIEDGASDWPTFAEKAKKLLQQDKVATIFGGWTSASRKAMLPVVEQNKGLLWYPVQYEGMESSPNIFYTGATTNQQIVPAVSWLLNNKGKKFFLIGSDYVFPRTANSIIKAQLKAEGGEVVVEEYTPLGHTDYSTVINKMKKVKPDVVFNTLNGDSNVAFFKQLKDAGITSKDVTVMSVSIAEEEIRGIGGEVLAGHLAVWNYFQTTDTPENKAFVEKYKEAYGEERVTDDPIEAAYIAVHLWAEAVKKAGSFEVEKVKEAAKGIEYKAPGGTVKIEGENQHLWKTVRIGEIQPDGQFKEIWNSGEPVKPDPYLKSYSWAEKLSKNNE